MSDGENSEPQKKKAKAKPPKNLAPHLWKKGQSGNPGGRPRDTLGLAALARNDVPKLFGKLMAVVDAMDIRHPSAPQMKAVEMYLERALGRPMTPIALGGSMNLNMTGPDGEPASALIIAAQRNREGIAYKAMLQGELARLENQEEQKSAEDAAKELEARALIAAGRAHEVSGLERLLIAAKDNARKDLPAPQPAPASTASTASAAQEPPPAPMRAAPPEAPPAPESTMKPAPEPAPQAASAAASPSAREPGAFNKIVARHAAERAEREAARAAPSANLPGGQVPAADWFKPDNPAASFQGGPPEIVTLTRGPLGSIRKI